MKIVLTTTSYSKQLKGSNMPKSLKELYEVKIIEILEK